MTSMQSRLSTFYAAINAIDDDLTFYHYERSNDCSFPCGVWAEEGEGESFHSGNAKTEQSIEGSLDYFTQTEFDSFVDDIQDTLNSIEGCSWSLSSVQYEDETKLIHFTWNWELI